MGSEVFRTKDPELLVDIIIIIIEVTLEEFDAIPLDLLKASNDCFSNHLAAGLYTS